MATPDYNSIHAAFHADQHEDVLRLGNELLRTSPTLITHKICNFCVASALQSRTPQSAIPFAEKCEELALSEMQDQNNSSRSLASEFQRTIKNYLILGCIDKIPPLIVKYFNSLGENFQNGINKTRAKSDIIGGMRFYKHLALHGIGREDYERIYNIFREVDGLFSEDNIKRLTPERVKCKLKPTSKLVDTYIKELMRDTEAGRGNIARSDIFEALETAADVAVTPLTVEAGKGAIGVPRNDGRRRRQ